MKRLLWWSLSIALVACGDIVVDPASGDPSPTGTVDTVDGGETILHVGVVCPNTEPSTPTYADGGVDGGHYNPASAAAECQGSGGLCEYGTSADPSCNHLVTCNGSSWTAIAPSGTCFASACPSSVTKVAAIEGTPCDLDAGANTADEALCTVADGQCTCTTGAGGADTHARTWTCARVTADCPVQRPSIGVRCFDEGLFCDYGSCITKAAIAVSCSNGQWQESSAPCD